MKPLSLIVRTGCDIFAWFMVVFGVNVLVHGYMTPGGGFQGGAIIATFTTFLLVAYGGRKVFSWVNESIYDVVFDEIGLLGFFILGFMGFPNSFFYNFLAIPFETLKAAGEGIIPGAGTNALMSIAVGIEVTGALSMVVLTMFKGIRLFSEGTLEEELGHDR